MSVSAVESLVNASNAEAESKLAISSKRASESVNTLREGVANVASQKLAQKAHGFSRSSFVVRIDAGEEPAVSPKLSGMSSPLREYMRMQNAVE